MKFFNPGDKTPETNFSSMGIHFYRGNAIVEECLVRFWLKSAENRIFGLIRCLLPVWAYFL